MSVKPCLLILCLSIGTAYGITIAAFNIQTFGVAKMDNPIFLANIDAILPQYDLFLVQEIRDASETAVYELLDLLNGVTPGDPYSLVLSERLGTSESYKEQYGYYYRRSKLTVVSTYQAPFGSFERPPFCVRFRPTNSGIPEFGYIGIHTKPEAAVTEIDAMVDTYNHLRGQWGIENFLFGGDFNAGCTYVTASDWANIRLRTDSRFVWFIGDNADTNVHTSVCAYDRLVGVGSAFTNSISRPGVFYFDDELNLSQTDALEISDHYPVECTLL